MTATAPRDLAELLDTLAESPETQLLAGGTDFMVEVNFGRRDPRAVVALRRVGDLRGWERDGELGVRPFAGRDDRVAVGQRRS